MKDCLVPISLDQNCGCALYTGARYIRDSCLWLSPCYLTGRPVSPSYLRISHQNGSFFVLGKESYLLGHSMVNILSINIGIRFKNEPGSFSPLVSPTSPYHQDGHHYQVLNEGGSLGYNMTVLQQREEQQRHGGRWSSPGWGVRPRLSWWPSLEHYLLGPHGRSASLTRLCTQRGMALGPLPEIKQHKMPVAKLTFSTLPVSVKKNDLQANSRGEIIFPQS